MPIILLVRRPAFSNQLPPGFSFSAIPKCSSFSSCLSPILKPMYSWVFLFSFGLQNPIFSACLVTQFDELLNVCPIHLHRFFLISSSPGFRLVCSLTQMVVIDGIWPTDTMYLTQTLIYKYLYLLDYAFRSSPYRFQLYTTELSSREH
ncbi:hypothetical protein EWB00_000023 [Schistosoma japonicum]|uniref:Uncharacterized protein n=1 Tax=Schistosoma japonicum TaxID=6182 RepID=A0A4Z2DKR7_SCHJA|nr:hypothetical protein EWB00_000023 [Schistosoma japonicum]TNN16997.1 hypothetical protein EWB00_000023 [Schistosoma japonicum]